MTPIKRTIHRISRLTPPATVFRKYQSNLALRPYIRPVEWQRLPSLCAASPPARRRYPTQSRCATQHFVEAIFGQNDNSTLDGTYLSGRSDAKQSLSEFPLPT